MVRNIVRLLSEEQRRRGVWVVFSVLTRMRCRITVCIAKEHLSYASGTCTKLLSVGNISGV